MTDKSDGIAKALKIMIMMSTLVMYGCVATPYEPVELSQVVNVSNKNQKEIYDNVRQWFSQYFVSGKSVIDYEDAGTGTIIGNGVARVGSDTFGIIKYGIRYNVRIDTKDNKLRMETKIIEHTNTDSDQTYPVSRVSDERQTVAANHINDIVEDIKKYVLSRSDIDSSW